MKIPFGEVVWTDEVLSPFSDRHHGDSDHRWGKDKVANPTELRAVAREFTPDYEKLIYDEPGELRQGKQKCVVVGKQRVAMIDENRKHYVLIIMEIGQDGGYKTYKRVGVGCVEGRHISLETRGECVIIQ